MYVCMCVCVSVYVSVCLEGQRVVLPGGGTHSDYYHRNPPTPFSSLFTSGVTTRSSNKDTAPSEGPVMCQECIIVASHQSYFLCIPKTARALRVPNCSYLFCRTGVHCLRKTRIIGLGLFRVEGGGRRDGGLRLSSGGWGIRSERVTLGLWTDTGTSAQECTTVREGPEVVRSYTPLDLPPNDSTGVYPK